jgi:hypothetical protein
MTEIEHDPFASGFAVWWVNIGSKTGADQQAARAAYYTGVAAGLDQAYKNAERVIAEICQREDA